MVTVLFDPKMVPFQVLSFWIRMDLEVKAIKGYSTFFKDSGLKLLYQCHIQDIRWKEELRLCRDAIGVFYSPSLLRCKISENSINTAILLSQIPPIKIGLIYYQFLIYFAIVKGVNIYFSSSTLSYFRSSAMQSFFFFCIVRGTLNIY